MNDISAQVPSAFAPEETANRRPRVALMGEFSAGKSTLANLMVGAGALPVQVVATQLPPVWITYGDGPTTVVDLEGRETPCDFDQLEAVDTEDIAYIRIFSTSEILQQCDLIDMPGISDPNMPSIVWERVLPFADAVLWCTPATQAWRQSEAATWESVDEKVRRNSVLVITRSDMLLTERDRTKVLKRVRNETSELFSKHVMMSLHLARDAEIDSPQWVESGVDTFVETFLAMVESLQAALPTEPHAAPRVSQAQPPQADVSAPSGNLVVPRRPATRRDLLLKDVPKPDHPAPDTVSYMPKFS